MRLPSDWRRLAATAGLVLGLEAVAGVAVALSGVYDVGASSGHWWWVTRGFAIARDRGIAVHADPPPQPDLADPGLAALGAQHYAGACAPCHGRPGEERNPTMEGMLPPPPDLTFAAKHYDPAELHFILQHGLKFAGMPAWPTQAREDEPWALVAFIEALGRGVPYADLAGEALAEDADGPRVPVEGDEPPALGRCARCHGDEATAPADDLVPPLGGQSPAYLARALTEYRDELRPSGIMMAVAHVLSDAEIAALADAYAGLETPPSEAVGPTGDPDAGAVLAREGAPGDRVAPCASCHEGASAARFGRLDGLPAPYLESQLALFVASDETPGQDRASTAYGAIMAEASHGLTPAMIRDLAAHYAAQPLPGAAP